MTDESTKSYFDVFAGGAPPGEVFSSHVEALLTLADGASNDLVGRNLPELCLIGLLPYANKI